MSLHSFRYGIPLIAKILFVVAVSVVVDVVLYFSNFVFAFHQTLKVLETIVSQITES